MVTAKNQIFLTDMDIVKGVQGVNTYDKKFWKALDRLVAESELVIDRPKGAQHPKYPEVIYEVDYGYLKGTSSMDGAGIDVWRGTNEAAKVDAVLLIVDLLKKDSEIKLLLGCTDEEKEVIYRFHNESQYMKGILINRKMTNEKGFNPCGG